jgi:hypothetical protein
MAKPRQRALVLLGVLIGLIFVVRQGPHLAQVALVGSVYVGLEIAGLLIGYGFLRAPLGFFPSRFAAESKRRRN